MDSKQLVSRREACQILGITNQLLGYYLKNGRGPSSETISGKFYIDKESLKTWKPAYKKLGRPKNKGLDNENLPPNR